MSNFTISKQRLREIIAEELGSENTSEKIMARLMEAWKVTQVSMQNNEHDVTLGGNGINTSELFMALKWIMQGDL